MNIFICNFAFCRTLTVTGRFLWHIETSRRQMYRREKWSRDGNLISCSLGALKRLAIMHSSLYSGAGQILVSFLEAPMLAVWSSNRSLLHFTACCITLMSCNGKRWLFYAACLSWWLGDPPNKQIMNRIKRIDSSDYRWQYCFVFGKCLWWKGI